MGFKNLKISSLILVILICLISSINIDFENPKEQSSADNPLVLPSKYPDQSAPPPEDPSEKMKLWNCSARGTITSVAISSDGNYLVAGVYNFFDGSGSVLFFNKSSSKPMWNYTTAIAVQILAKPCHIASMPVAVNIQCHVHRHKSAVI